MKKISIFLLIFATVVGFYSCQKEAPKVVLNPANIKAPTLKGLNDGASITFTKAQSDSVMQFTWTPAQYGFKAAVKYFLQIAKAGTNFADALSLGNTESKDTLKVKVADFNNKVNTMKANPQSVLPVDVQMRLIAIVNDHVDTVFSQTINVTVNTFFIPIVYPQLYVPGSYQGWAPDKADSIGSIKSNSQYEGYIYMKATPPIEFKFTSKRAWDGTNYGAGATAGTLSTDGGAGNLSVPDSGYYKFNVDTQALTWSYLKTTWGLIGSATPDGWNSGQPMTFSPATGLWTITLNLVKGEVKFRANKAWDLNYGSDNNDGLLQPGGKNIVIPADGKYTIVLDLRHTVYRYKIIKK